MRLLVLLLILLTPIVANCNELAVIEEAVRINVPQWRLTRFLVRNKVHNPKYYAELLMRHPMPFEEKKLFASILIPETRGALNKTSSCGAKGPWQVMPSWKKTLKIKGSLQHPPTNLDAAYKVYKIHEKEVRGSRTRALYAYSGGSNWYPGLVQGLIATI